MRRSSRRSARRTGPTSALWQLLRGLIDVVVVTSRAHVVAREVQGDLCKPRSRPEVRDALAGVALECLVCPHERFLGHIFSARGVANDPQSYSENEVLVRSNQVTEATVEVRGEPRGQIVHAHTGITQPVTMWLQ